MNEVKSISKAFSDRFKEVDKLFSQSFGSFGHWFLADVAYTLLPIGIIASIKALTFDQGDYLYLSPEWSFATIVSFGAAITNLIEIKTEIQQDFSYRIYMGTRLYILLLIMSVIVLCLVVLRDDGLNINSRILWAIQLSLLFLSIASLYIAHMAKRKQLRFEAKYPSDMGRGRYYKALNKRIKKIQEDLLNLRFAIRKYSEISFSTTMSPADIEFWECNERNRLIQELHQMEESMKDIHNLSDELLKFAIPKITSDDKESRVPEDTA